MTKKISVIFICIFLLVLCVMDIDKDETCKGQGFANPRQIGELDLYGKDDYKFNYYKPVSTVEESKIGSHLLSRVDFSPLEGKGIFDYDEKLLFVVENKDNESGEIFQHCQLQYIANRGQFIIFSAYEVKDINLDLLKKDMFGNKVNIYSINNETAIQVTLTTNQALTYSYYTYDEEENLVHLTSTAANEIFSFKDGVLYHVAYTIDINNEELNNVFDKFVK